MLGTGPLLGQALLYILGILWTGHFRICHLGWHLVTDLAHEVLRDDWHAACILSRVCDDTEALTRRDFRRAVAFIIVGRWLIYNIVQYAIYNFVKLAM